MQALIADFEVSESIYSRARIEDTDSVCLWLGANVMLEYSCEEVGPEDLVYGSIHMHGYDFFKSRVKRPSFVLIFCFL